MIEFKEGDMVEVWEMVEKYLKDNSYDGLYNYDAECACDLSELFPCNQEGIHECCAGYKAPCDCGDHDWHIQREKPKGKQ